MRTLAMQDLLALGIAALAAVWLARTLVRRCVAPPCRPPEAPPGSDGFVPLHVLSARATSRPLLKDRDS